jgi:hypothetical protein
MWLYDPQLSYRQADCYRNLGGGRFRNVSAESGPAFRIQHVGRGWRWRISTTTTWTSW